MLARAYALRHFKEINLITRYKFSLRSKFQYTGEGFKSKGLSDENRYFIKQQEEQIRKLRKYMARLEQEQKKLQGRLNKTSKILKDIEKKTEQLKKE